jgi:hypothetical protein
LQEQDWKDVFFSKGLAPGTKSVSTGTVGAAELGCKQHGLHLAKLFRQAQPSSMTIVAEDRA